MGEVVVLSPQKDLFRDRPPRSHSFINSTMRSRPNANANANASRISPPSPNPNFNSRSNFDRSIRRRRSPTLTKRVQNKSLEPQVSLPATKNLVMGQVRILKRGEALTDINDPKSISPGFANLCKTRSDDVSSGDDLVTLSSTDRLGPEPEMVPVKIQAGDWYAGSGFVSSPPPSSLPLPVFFSKKKNPTSDLRRILGLDI